MRGLYDENGGFGERKIRFVELQERRRIGDDKMKGESVDGQRNGDGGVGIGV